ncbi:DUF2085 domain-containing protein [Gracilimonas sp. Q87]|uniref:DUF2085 domain-containing protein n=1 Tax=Gracilimonas sp. Q87 TaxID=3384766 RepID=UPI0039843FB6
MNKTHTQNGGLYLSVTGASVLLFVLALGPGLYGSEYSHLFSWQYKGFDLLCHQMPDRSYHIAGVPMAVCSRCIGIYGAFVVGWLALPIFSKVSISHKTRIGWLIGLIILNLVDVTGNFFEMWSNTLTTRLVLGTLLGLSVAVLFNDEFFSHKKRIEYG